MLQSPRHFTGRRVVVVNGPWAASTSRFRAGARRVEDIEHGLFDTPTAVVTVGACTFRDRLVRGGIHPVSEAGARTVKLIRLPRRRRQPQDR